MTRHVHLSTALCVRHGTTLLMPTGLELIAAAMQQVG
eukprot:COSAG03_NODE_25948_length_262_cov_0.926380_2_plen_36_part_01